MVYSISGADCMIAEWVLLIVVYTAVAIRVYTRQRHLRERLSWAEWLLMISAIVALGLVICDTLTYRTGAMDSHITSEKLSKILFSSNYFYDVGLAFPKISMLAFYWEFFQFEHRRTMRNTLLGISVFVPSCYLITLFDDTFYCGKDVSVQWSQEDGACSVFYAQTPWFLNFSLGLACYLTIYTWPLIALYQGALKASANVGLVFALGALAIGSAVIRFACLKAGTGQENLVYILSMVEMTLSIIVVSISGLWSRRKVHERSYAASENLEEGRSVSSKLGRAWLAVTTTHSL